MPVLCLLGPLTSRSTGGRGQERRLRSFKRQSLSGSSVDRGATASRNGQRSSSPPRSQQRTSTSTAATGVTRPVKERIVCPVNWKDLKLVCESDARVRHLEMERPTKLPILTKLADSLKTNTTLETIRVLNVGCNDRSALAICTALRESGTTALQRLTLTHCQVGPAAAEALGALLRQKSTPQWTELDLSYNQIGNVGARALACGMLLPPAHRNLGESPQEGALSIGCPLRKLNLTSNNIGNAGVVALCQVLTTRTPTAAQETSVSGSFSQCLLEELTLSYNPSVGDEGIVALREAVQVNSTLSHLGLDGLTLVQDDYSLFAITNLLSQNRRASACHSEPPFPVPEYLQCPLTRQLFYDPVLASDGCIYERSAILQWWWSSSGVSSVSGQPVPLPPLLIHHRAMACLAHSYAAAVADAQSRPVCLANDHEENEAQSHTRALLKRPVLYSPTTE